MTPLKTAFLAATALVTAGATAASAAPLSDLSPQTVRPADARGLAGIEPLLREAGFSDYALGTLHEVARHESPVSNRTYVTYEQRVLGRPVHASYLRAVIEPDGTLSQLVHRLANVQPLGLELPVSAPVSTLQGVIRAPFGTAAPAVARTEPGLIVFEKGDDYQAEPTAQSVYVADEDGTLSPATMVRAWAKADNQLVHTLVGADGRVLDREDRTSNDSYVAYRTTPGRGNATVIQGSEADRAASPNGWLGGGAQYSVHISGNNAAAYVDANKDNAPDGGGARVTDGRFDTVANLNEAPTTTRNKEAAVQNLFYHVNAIHDRLYRHGFTETAGNFQLDNFGRGGRGGDYVRAEVLDGGGTNNANFATPMDRSLITGDGGAPRMQMYRYTSGNPDRAGSLDADIIWHEYGHGVLWRMVGDLDWPTAWPVNEGFADALAIVATGEDRVGEWARNNDRGIRSARYANTPKRLGSYKAGRGYAHSNGEIYGAASWALREEFRKAGKSDDSLLALMIDGLANTAPRPDFLDMRDGLLAAGGSADDCRVWRAFAKVGMGEGSSISWSGSKGSPSVSVRESSRVPSSCSSSSPSPSPAPPPPPSGGPKTDVWYALQNVSTGQFLDTDPGGVLDADGSDPGTSGQDRHWRFTKLGNGAYTVRSRASGRGVIDTNKYGQTRWVTQASATSSETDKHWRVDVRSDGTVTLRNGKDGRDYLEATSAGQVRYNVGGASSRAVWRLVPRG